MKENSCVNKVLLLGRIIKEPRWHDCGGERILSFSVMTVENIGRENADHTETHSIRIGERLINVHDLNKGAIVYVQGRLQTQQFTDEQMVRRYRTYVNALSVNVVNI
jgi:single-strand DNA-binding protein